jgi:hypothetical protein
MSVILSYLGIGEQANGDGDVSNDGLNILPENGAGQTL